MDLPGRPLKPGKLEDDEEDMKRHPSYAYEWLSPLPFLSSALDTPYCHHEKGDGSGPRRRVQARNAPKSPPTHPR